ncbi:hypothetical protein [Streptomyces arboris]|uniref:hypothetical protein n=1 Tax=Streptomyces arboris TaxID=2600619 RepID=UPI003BF4E626
MFFTVHIDGSWQLAEIGPKDRRDPTVLARHHLRECTRRALTRHTVLERAAAQDAVNLAIAHTTGPEGDALAVGGIADLTVTEADLALAEEHLRREQLGDLDRGDEHRRLIFRQRILADPDLRPVWWIDQYPERINELERLDTAVQGLRPPRGLDHGVLRDEIVRFIDHLLTDIRTPHQREIFLRALTQTLHTLGSTELRQTAATWLPTPRTDSGDDSV